jgi:hypothetical protein
MRILEELGTPERSAVPALVVRSLLSEQAAAVPGKQPQYIISESSKRANHGVSKVGEGEPV